MIAEAIMGACLVITMVFQALERRSFAKEREHLLASALFAAHENGRIEQVVAPRHKAVSAQADKPEPTVAIGL